MYLNFIATTIQLEVGTDAAEDFEPVRRFFRHLCGPTPAAEPVFTVTVGALPAGADGDPDGGTVGDPVVIRRSSAPEFTFLARVSRSGGRVVYRNQHTVLDAPLDARRDSSFRLAISPGSTVQVIDFLRDLVIRHEETAGTVVLHASAVIRDGQVYAIAGPKGAGKTTTLLSVLRRPGWSYFTGDKLFCRPDGDQIMVRPWRDYPYVGVGTLRAHPQLADRVRSEVAPGLDSWADQRKILLDPDRFESWLGADFDTTPRPLAGLLLPAVAPGEPLAVQPMQDSNARWAVLNTVLDRSVDTTFFGWQHHYVPDYAAFYATLSRLRPLLPALTVLRLTGTLDVDLDAVLATAGATVAEPSVAEPSVAEPSVAEPEPVR